MGILKHDDILDLHSAVIEANLVDSRDELLVGIDPHFVAGLPRARAASDQIFRDLSALSQAGTLLDRTVPLKIWLKNAIARAGSKPQSQVFRAVLQRCNGETSASQPKPIEQSQTGPIWKAGDLVQLRRHLDHPALLQVMTSYPRPKDLCAVSTLAGVAPASVNWDQALNRVADELIERAFHSAKLELLIREMSDDESIRVYRDALLSILRRGR